MGVWMDLARLNSYPPPLGSLSNTLQELTAKAHGVPLSLEYLNGARFTPTKNNNLVSA